MFIVPSLADQVPIDKVKKVLKIFLKELESQGHNLFQNQPTGEVFFKGPDLVGVSLLDENREEMTCYFSNNPKNGKYYIFLPMEQLNKNMLPFLGVSSCYKIIQQFNSDTAFAINIDRVDKLLNDKYYSIALVFVVSVLENVLKDIFFLHNELWFSMESEEVHKFSQDILRKVGTKLDPKMKDDYKEKMFTYLEEINGEIIGIERDKLQIANKWKDVEYWERVHDTCEKIGIYPEYIKIKMGNHGIEIGRFEILKEILKRKNILNFQLVYGNRSIKKSFETFFNIELKAFSKELDFIKENINKRHRIIHGTLKDDEIDQDTAENFKAIIVKFVSYLGEKIRSLYTHRQMLMFGVFV